MSTPWLMYLNRIQVDIDLSPHIVNSLTNFPVTLRLDTNNAADVFAELGGNAKRIAVTTDDGTTQCYVDIEFWDATAQQATLHVKVPTVSHSAVTTLWLYFDNTRDDNTTYVGHTGEEAAQQVWSSYTAVWHMNGDPSSVIKDATSWGYDLTPESLTNFTSGHLGTYAQNGYQGKGIDFNGINELLATAHSPDPKSPFDPDLHGYYHTGEVVAQFKAGLTLDHPVLASNNWDVTYYDWHMGVYDAAGPCRPFWSHDGGNTTGFDALGAVPGDLVYFHLRRLDYNDAWLGAGPSDRAKYITSSRSNWNAQYYHAAGVGGRISGGNYYYYPGVIAEVRISSGKRSDDWIDGTYRTLMDPSVATYNTTEAQTPPPEYNDEYYILGATKVSGGQKGSLDAVDPNDILGDGSGVIMSVNHRAIVIEEDKLSLYRPNWWPGQIEDYPNVIIPDVNPSDWAWVEVPIDADTLQGLAASAFAAAGHNHDSAYALISHNHDGTYALAGHNHDAAYLGISAKAADADKLDGKDSTEFALLSQLAAHHDPTSADHDDRYYTEAEIDALLASYSLTSHSHDGTYAAAGHNHDTAYLGITAQAADADTVDGLHSSAFAAAAHNHDSAYAPASHNHDAAYLGIGAKAADADKLDGIDSSGFVKTGDYQDADVLAKIKNVDGPSSGLNADLLDNAHASAFAKMSLAQEWTKAQNFNQTALTISSGSVAWDLQSNQVAKVNLTENVTINAPTNMKEGGTYILEVIQTSTANCTVSWNSAFKWDGGSAPDIAMAAHKRTIFMFKSDGVSMFGAKFFQEA